MQVIKAAASQLVTFFEGKGLVERVADPSDRRARLIRATPAADLGFRAARDVYAEVEAEWRALLGAERLEQLADSLKELGSCGYCAVRASRAAALEPAAREPGALNGSACDR